MNPKTYHFSLYMCDAFEKMVQAHKHVRIKISLLASGFYVDQQLCLQERLHISLKALHHLFDDVIRLVFHKSAIKFDDGQILFDCLPDRIKPGYIELMVRPFSTNRIQCLVNPDVTFYLADVLTQDHIDMYLAACNRMDYGMQHDDENAIDYQVLSVAFINYLSSAIDAERVACHGIFDALLRNVITMELNHEYYQEMKKISAYPSDKASLMLDFMVLSHDSYTRDALNDINQQDLLLRMHALLKRYVAIKTPDMAFCYDILRERSHITRLLEQHGHAWIAAKVWKSKPCVAILEKLNVILDSMFAGCLQPEVDTSSFSGKILALFTEKKADLINTIQSMIQSSGNKFFVKGSPNATAFDSFKSALLYALASVSPLIAYKIIQSLLPLVNGAAAKKLQTELDGCDKAGDNALATASLADYLVNNQDVLAALTDAKSPALDLLVSAFSGAGK